MLGSWQNNHYRKPLKDANFLSVQLCVYTYVYVYHMFTRRKQQMCQNRAEFI